MRRLKENGKVLAMLLRKSRGNYLQLWLQICRKSTCLWTNTERKMSLGVEWKVLFPTVTSFGINKNWFLKVDLAMVWAFFQGIVWSLQQWGWQFWHVLGKWRPLPCLWCPQVGSTPVQHQTVPVYPGTLGAPGEWARQEYAEREGCIHLLDSCLPSAPLFWKPKLSVPGW